MRKKACRCSDSIIPQPSNCALGTKIIDALRLLKRGAISLQAYPYRDGRCQKPTRAEQTRATDFQIADWQAVDVRSLDQVKGELAKGHPVVIGIRVREPLKSI